MTNIPFLKGVKISQRDRKIIAIGLVAATLILVTWLVMSFNENKKKIREDLKEKKEAMQRYLQIIEEKDDYKKMIVELNKRLEQYNARLLPESSPAPAKQKLEDTIIDMASKAGVDPSNRRPEREEKLNDEYQKISVRMDQSLCMPDQAANFLHQIRTFDKYYLTIEQLDIQPSSYATIRGGPKDNKIRLGVTISAIIRVQPEKKEEQAPRGKPATTRASLETSEPYYGRKQS